MAKAKRFGLELRLSHLSLSVLGACVLKRPAAPPLTLSLSLFHSLSVHSLLTPTPSTIHSPTLALISPLVRCLFRVGSDVEDLLVTGYAWTPRSWRTVVVSSLGFGKDPIQGERSAPDKNQPWILVDL